MKILIFIPHSICADEFPVPTYKVKHLDDWGQTCTIGIHVKKIGTDGNSSNDKFGIYLGLINGKYSVARYSNEVGEEFKLNFLECFDTLSELKHTWIID